jgi:hypothetical protein
VQTANLCIGTQEPAFQISLAIGVVAAVLLAGALVKLEATLQGKTFVALRRSLAWAAAEAVVLVGPMVLTVLLHALLHPEQELCTSLVWRWYLLPPVVLVVAGVAGGVLAAVHQRRHAST